MDIDGAIALLPHREPFLFVSRLERIVPGEGGEGVWAVRGDEAFFAGHFPGEPIVPGMLLAEALAQLAGIVAASGHNASGRLASVNIRFRASVRPPAEVHLEVEVERSIGRLWLFNARACSAGVDVATGSLAVAMDAPKEETGG